MLPNGGYNLKLGFLRMHYAGISVYLTVDWIIIIPLKTEKITRGEMHAHDPTLVLV